MTGCFLSFRDLPGFLSSPSHDTNSTLGEQGRRLVFEVGSPGLGQAMLLEALDRALLAICQEG